MSVFYVGLCILLIPLLIISAKTKINIKKDEGFELRINLLFFSKHFTNLFQRNGERLPIGFYRQVIKRLLRLLEKSDITVNSLVLPKTDEAFSASTTVKPYGYYSVICSIIALLSERAKSLTVKDGSLILIQDECPKLKFDLTVSTRLYNIIFSLLPLLIELWKAKKQKKEIKDVRN